METKKLDVEQHVWVTSTKSNIPILHIVPFELSCGYVFSSSAMVKIEFVYMDWQAYNTSMQLVESLVLNINARCSCIRYTAVLNHI